MMKRAAILLVLVATGVIAWRLRPGHDAPTGAADDVDAPSQPARPRPHIPSFAAEPADDPRAKSTAPRIGEVLAKLDASGSPRLVSADDQLRFVRRRAFVAEARLDAEAARRLDVLIDELEERLSETADEAEASGGDDRAVTAEIAARQVDQAFERAGQRLAELGPGARGAAIAAGFEPAAQVPYLLRRRLAATIERVQPPSR